MLAVLSAIALIITTIVCVYFCMKAIIPCAIIAAVIIVALCLKRRSDFYEARYNVFYHAAQDRANLEREYAKEQAKIHAANVDVEPEEEE